MVLTMRTRRMLLIAGVASGVPLLGALTALISWVDATGNARAPELWQTFWALIIVALILTPATLVAIVHCPREE